MGGNLNILTSATALAAAGGLELCTYQDSTALLQRGHRVQVLYERDGKQRAVLEDAGARVDGPFRFGFDPRHALRDLGRFWPAAKLVRKSRANVLWLNRPEHIIWAQIVARFAGIPIVCHLHHAPNFRWTRLVNVGVTHFIAVSRFERKQWIDRGIQQERITVLHNAILTTDYPVGDREEQKNARQTLGIDRDLRVVLFCGRITAGKGILTLIEAWRRLHYAPGRALLVLAGPLDATEAPAVERALAEMTPGSYRPFPAQSQVLPFLHAADIIVVPSLDAEPFGRVVIEGMATGRSVIASRSGGIPEILFGTMDRFLVAPGAGTEFVAQIDALLDWRRTEPRLGAACHAWVEENFPYAEHVNRLEQLLQRYGRVRKPGRLAGSRRTSKLVG